MARKMKFEPILPTESGIKVRSKYEQRCADYLYTCGITFQYEPLILLEGRKYRPDFYLPHYNLFIEICGYGHMPFYNDRIRQKKRVYEKEKINAIFILYNGRGSLEDILRDRLVDVLDKLRSETEDDYFY
jgi:hypothetical protein